MRLHKLLEQASFRAHVLRAVDILDDLQIVSTGQAIADTPTFIHSASGDMSMIEVAMAFKIASVTGHVRDIAYTVSTNVKEDPRSAIVTHFIFQKPVAWSRDDKKTIMNLNAAFEADLWATIEHTITHDDGFRLIDNLDIGSYDSSLGSFDKNDIKRILTTISGKTIHSELHIIADGSARDPIGALKANHNAHDVLTTSFHMTGKTGALMFYTTK